MNVYSVRCQLKSWHTHQLLYLSHPPRYASAEEAILQIVQGGFTRPIVALCVDAEVAGLEDAGASAVLVKVRLL